MSLFTVFIIGLSVHNSQQLHLAEADPALPLAYCQARSLYSSKPWLQQMAQQLRRRL